MRRGRLSIIALLMVMCPAALAQHGSQQGAQQGSKQGAQQARSTAAANSPEMAEVIRRFAAAETENKVARNNYTFTQDFDLVTIGEAGSITGRFKRVSDIVFDDRSNRVEKITYFPPSTLTSLGITPQDMQDLAGVQPFALTTEDLSKYSISYSGKEKLDELNTYVFEVKPKEFRKGERYLQGKIWVDDQDLQIVKVAGQGVPEDSNNKYPHFESYRENIGGRYWFPTYVYADDILGFKSGDVHLKMTVRYTNYKKFAGRIRVVDDAGEPDDDSKNNQSKPPQSKPPAANADSGPKVKKP
jgi:hypothetical protein